MKTKILSAKTLPKELDKVISFVEAEPQINASGIRDLLSSLVKAYKKSYTGLYQDIKSYCNQCQKAIDENRENSFDNQAGMLNRLNKIKEDYN